MVEPANRAGTVLPLHQTRNVEGVVADGCEAAGTAPRAPLELLHADHARVRAAAVVVAAATIAVAAVSVDC